MKLLLVFIYLFNKSMYYISEMIKCGQTFLHYQLFHSIENDLISFIIYYCGMGCWILKPFSFLFSSLSFVIRFIWCKFDSFLLYNWWETLSWIWICDWLCCDLLIGYCHSFVMVLVHLTFCKLTKNIKFVWQLFRDCSLWKVYFNFDL